MTALQSCCKTSSAKTKIPPDWCMESQAFPLAPRSSWKCSSRCPDVFLESHPTHIETRNRLSHHSRSAMWVVIAKIDGSGLQLWWTRIVRCARLVARSDQERGDRG